MNDDKVIYRSHTIHIGAITAVLISTLLLITILFIDRSNPNLALVVSVLIVSIFLVYYFGRDITLKEDGLIVNGKNILWENIKGVESDKHVILNTLDYGKITISLRYDSFFEILSHIKKHKTNLFTDKTITIFNDNIWWIIVNILQIFTGLLYITAFIIHYYVVPLSLPIINTCLLIISPVILILDRYFHNPVIINNKSVTIKRFFTKNKIIHYCDIRNIQLDNNSKDVWLILTNGGKEIIYNHYTNTQFLYENLKIYYDKSKDILKENQLELKKHNKRFVKTGGRGGIHI